MSSIDEIKGEVKAGIDFIMESYEKELKKFCENNECDLKRKMLLNEIKNQFHEDLKENKFFDFTLLIEKKDKAKNNEIKKMLGNLLDELREFRDKKFPPTKKSTQRSIDTFTVVSGNKTYKDYIIYALIVIAVIALFKFFSANKDKINNRFN